MKMIEEMEDKDPFDFLFSQLSILIQTKPQRKEELFDRLQEFIDANR
jgi:hypothetical protein